MGCVDQKLHNLASFNIAELEIRQGILFQQMLWAKSGFVGSN